jgi:UDP-N-acetylglucosamine 1-carboxyvinyltransferase
LKGLKKIGLKIVECHGYIEGKTEGLVGNTIHLDFPSVGATENLVMAACLAKGTTILRNAAREPEIVDLQNYLNSLGANVKGAGLDVIKIEGVKKLGTLQVEHTIIPDRIEAGTHMIASAITGGKVEIKNIIVEHLEPVIAKLKECGIIIEDYNDRIVITATSRANATNLRTLPYPGFPTDLQPQMMTLLTLAKGTSIISENIFENRFKHVDELRRMGADIKVEGRIAIINGTDNLSGAFVEATDLRAGAALLLAGLHAEDATVIENIYHIERGYDNLDKKYCALGAKIIRVNNTNGSK